MISRRAFLGTMLVAGVGAAANFDPTKGLWVPGPVEGAPAPEILLPDVTWTKAIVDETAEGLSIRMAKEWDIERG